MTTALPTSGVGRARVKALRDAEDAQYAPGHPRSAQLLARVTPRVTRLIEALRACRGDVAIARRRFAKLPAEYETLLERAVRQAAPR